MYMRISTQCVFTQRDRERHRDKETEPKAERSTVRQTGRHASMGKKIAN